jgi:methyl-accepting chemotaxis protein
MGSTDFGRGLSTTGDTAKATRQALEAAASGIDDREATNLAVAMSGPSHDAETIRETVQSELGDVPLVGSTTAGEFTDEELSEDGVVISLVASENYAVETGHAEGVSEDVFSTVQEAVDALPDPAEMEGEHSAAVTFHNGLAGKGEQITLVTGQLLGDMPLAGGSAGDNLALEETTVFSDDGVSADGVVVAQLSSHKPFAVASNHGHTPLSESYTVTETEENVVHELDGEPAYEVWKDEIADHVREEYGVDVESLSADDEEFAELLNQFELGIETGDGEYKIRWPAMTDSTEGPLKFATGVPEDSEVNIMHSPKDEQIDSARQAARNSLERFEGGDVAGAFVFDCVCRGLILDDDFDQAVGEIADELDAPLAGFETYGEVCMPPEAASGYHNTTTAVLLLPS